MLKVHREPSLRSPVLLCAFSGWADAATAASGAMRYLLLKRDSRRFAEFDPDAIYSYTTTRPLTSLDSRGQRQLHWPELPWMALEVPEGDRDLVVLVGPEPDLRWRECVEAIIALASRLQVSQILAFGAFLAQVHYSGPPALMGVTSDLRTRTRMRALGISETNYQGPTSFITALTRSAADRSIPASSLWVAAPNYLSNAANPRLSAGLLEAAEYLLGQELWLDELKAAGRDMERRITEALRARPDLANFLQRLSGESEQDVEQIDLSAAAGEAPPSPEETEPELPSAEEIIRHLEDHLRRIKDQGGDEDAGPETPS